MFTANRILTRLVCVKSNKNNHCSTSGSTVINEAVFKNYLGSYKRKNVKLTVEKNEAKCSAVQQHYDIMHQMTY